PEGTISKVRPVGPNGELDVASPRTRPGYLQIEEQVFKDPKLLKDTLAHDMTYLYVRSGQGNIARLATMKSYSALDLLEEMVKNGGQMTKLHRILGLVT